MVPRTSLFEYRRPLLDDFVLKPDCVLAVLEPSTIGRKLAARSLPLPFPRAVGLSTSTGVRHISPSTSIPASRSIPTAMGYGFGFRRTFEGDAEGWRDGWDENVVDENVRPVCAVVVAVEYDAAEVWESVRDDPCMSSAERILLGEGVRLFCIRGGEYLRVGSG